MEAIDPPTQIGPEKDISLTGLLMPTNGPNLVLVNMMGVDPTTFYLPLFGDEDKLYDVLERAHVAFDGIKQITDGSEFLESVPPSIIVVTNLRFTEEGRIRFTQVQR